MHAVTDASSLSQLHKRRLQMANVPPHPDEKNEETRLADNEKGGFHCDFVKKPSQDVQYVCLSCSLVLREPHKSHCCAKNFCRVCAEKIKADNKPCPQCNEEFFSAIHDKVLQRSLYELEVYCSHKQEGCEWTGPLGQLDDHLNLSAQPDKLLEGCIYSEIKCNYCSELKKRCNMTLHQKDQCPKLPLKTNAPISNETGMMCVWVCLFAIAYNNSNKSSFNLEFSSRLISRKAF